MHLPTSYAMERIATWRAYFEKGYSPPEAVREEVAYEAGPQAQAAASSSVKRLMRNNVHPRCADSQRGASGYKGGARVFAAGSDRSRNTCENVMFTGQLIKPTNQQTWVLVTSAMDMPRGVFRKAGFQVLPYPVDYTTGKGATLDLVPNVVRNLASLDQAAHEWFGLIAYRLAVRKSYSRDREASSSGRNSDLRNVIKSAAGWAAIAIPRLAAKARLHHPILPPVSLPFHVSKQIGDLA